MNKKDAEKQRNLDNKKLIKQTMTSELKEQKKFHFKSYIGSVIAFFIAFMISDFVIEKFSIEPKILAFVVELIIIMIALCIKEIMEHNLHK